MAAVDLGIARYREARLEQDPSKQTPEIRLISDLMGALVPALEQLQTDTMDLKPMKGASIWGYPILSMDADRLALLTLVTMINMADTTDIKYLDVCLAVGNAVKIEREFDLIKKTNKDVFRTIMNYKRTDKTHIVKAVRKRAGIVDEPWDKQQRVHVGAILVETAITNTTAFDYHKFFSNGRYHSSITLCKEVKAVLESMHGECELLRPFHLPMVVKPGPRRINDQAGGGYRYTKTNLVKGEDPVLQDSEIVVGAINAIQDTGYQIKSEVLQTYVRAWESGGGFGDMPTASPVALPVIPKDMDTNKEVKREWKAQARRIHDLNNRTNAKRKGALHKLWIANKFKDRKVLYFPAQFDWRSREYPLPSHLHPQADDPARALLTFSEGKPLGEHGLKWLGIHLANCYGYDKLGITERINALHSNGLNEIQCWVRDPVKFDSWKEKDKPWQALAAAYEYIAALDSRDPTGFISHLPVAVDGTCNGLQHFSAIGLDPVGAIATNLLDGLVPNDIYVQVCNEVNAIIEEDCRECDPNPDRYPCWAWKGRVDRKTVKRAVMTTPYGVTKQGIREQFVVDGHTDDLAGSVSVNACYLRDVVYDAIGSVVVAAREYMDWLRTVATIASSSNHKLHWTTPAGFKVKQAYLKDRECRVVTTLQEIYLRVPVNDWLINSRRQVNGLPPNFIHSLDAAHMMLTVVAAKQQGINSFQMIHDSYATHAADMERFSYILRDEFVKMHEQLPLWSFKEQIEQACKIELPPPPPQGSFDLSKVRTSRHFFS